MQETILVLLQVGPQEGPNLLDFFAEAGPVAKLILAILVLFSLASWAVMIGKAVQMRNADRQSRQFLDAFHRSSRFSEVNALAGRLHASPLVGIFQAGYAEIDSQIKHARGDRAEAEGAGRADYRISSLAALQRTLSRAVLVESRGISRWVSLLATTAAVTPFIGLFGTVRGIMEAFRDIGMTGSTSIVAVAPGIAEALINTAAGLGAAIPALVGYNYFANRLRGLRSSMEDFALEFLNLAERNFT